MPMEITGDLLLLTPANEIEHFINQSLIDYLRSVISGAKSEVETRVREVVRKDIEDSDTYRSILGGRLRYEFGIRSPQGVLHEIVDKILDGVRMDYLPPAANLGGMLVTAIPDDYSDIIPIGIYDSISRLRGTSTPIPWLEWLLTEGTAPVVEFGILTGNRPYKGTRTSEAVMVPIKGKVTNAYGVSEEYAGTHSDNWFTRLVAEHMGEATLQIMSNVLQEAF